MPLATPPSKEEFIAAVMGASSRAATLSYNARMLLTAWAAYESGWGKTTQARLGNNLFNVSKGSTWAGPVLAGKDTELTPGTIGEKKITQAWRVYGDMTAAIADVLALLKNSRFINYREAYVLLTSDAPSFATALGVNDVDSNGVTIRVENRPNTAGYYTFPRSKYQAAITKIFGEVESTAAKLGGSFCAPSAGPSPLKY